MFFSVIFLLGAVHGVALAVLLATNKVNRLSNLILGALMLVFSLDLAMASFLGFELQSAYPHFIGLDFPVTFLYGPLLYLYTKSLAERMEKLHPSDWIHLLPFVLVVLLMIPFYLFPGSEKLAAIAESGELDYGWNWFAHFKVLFNICYLPFIIIQLNKNKKALKDNFSSLDKRNLDWLQVFITSGILLAMVAVVIHLLSTFSESKSFYADLMLLSVTVFVYAIGYMGLRQPEFFTEFGDTGQEKEKGVEVESYSKSGLDEDSAKANMEKLTQIMEEEKPYLNSELNLRELAYMLQVSPHNLTEIINRYAGRNFYDFVNSYRVEEIKERLNDPESQNLTLLALAMDSGFNAKSSFNAVFKKHTGMTPTQYRKSLK